jgi:hypothetical protein
MVAKKERVRGRAPCADLLYYFAIIAALGRSAVGQSQGR